MAEFTKRDETTMRRVYALPNPTNWVEVSKLLTAIQRDGLLPPGEYDDTVTVEADEEEIRFSFVVEPEPR